jgi:hypothetical protein
MEPRLDLGNIECGLKAELKPKLSYAGVDSCTGYDSECKRRKIRIRICKLGVIEGVEELGTKLKTTAIMGPAKSQQF